MGTFIKTFFVCLILTFGFLAYKLVGSDSYSDNLITSKNSPVFGVHKELPEAKPVDKKVSENPEKSKQELPQNPQVKYEHKCYFYSNNGELVLITRNLSFKPSLENSIILLLKGPLISETQKGIYSEIPTNVDLIGVSRVDKKVIVNLSANFGNGGGTKSIQDRILQLAKTVKLHEPKKNIYLHINGKEVEYLGGDGVYVEQPLK